MRSNREPDQTPTIMMEPMIDVVFLLLIFFLVSATIRKKHSELPLELPHLTGAKTEKDPDNTVVVSIMPTSGGGIHYRCTTVGEALRSTGGAREDVTLQELVTKLRVAAKQKPGRKVRIDADSAVPYHVVSQVIDHCELYRLTTIGLRTHDNFSS